MKENTLERRLRKLGVLKADQKLLADVPRAMMGFKPGWVEKCLLAGLIDGVPHLFLAAPKNVQHLYQRLKDG